MRKGMPPTKVGSLEREEGTSSRGGLARAPIELIPAMQPWRLLRLRVQFFFERSPSFRRNEELIPVSFQYSSADFFSANAVEKESARTRDIEISFMNTSLGGDKDEHFN